MTVGISIIRSDVVGLENDFLICRWLAANALVLNVLLANEVELNLSHDDLVGQRVANAQRVVQMVSASQDVKLVVFFVDGAVRLTEDLF